MVERNHSEADPVLLVKSCRVYPGNDVPQMVLLSSLMINLPVKFIRGKFDYFLGRLNSIFYEEASALQFFVLTVLLFVRTFCVNLTVLNRFKAFCRPAGKGALRATFPLGHGSNRTSL